ncbi:MAG TPA: glycosyltransferase family 4 protein [Alphaproteobacteria bacterium]|jgi:glycosyltransferase involved in cell wall biosynthesis|nr:glycosyltransferase family 4 protein [Alphaproteobacteria bacterium]
MPTDFDTAPEPLVRRDVRPLTVLQVLPRLVVGGAERGTVDMAAAIQAAGGIAIVASQGGPMVHELERAKAKHIKLPLASKNPLVIWRNARRLARVIRKHNVDIIHARSRAPAWSALWAARKTGIRFVTTYHDTYAAESGWKKRYNSVMARGERVIAISHFVADHVRAQYGIGDDVLRVIPRGIEPTRFDPARVPIERKIKLAQEWSLPDDQQIILMPARLSRKKGHKLLVEALAKLGRKDVRCLMVGDDQRDTGYRRELLHLIHERELDGVVRLLPHTTDLSVAYSLADVVVAPSIKAEGFGRVPVEAQAMGRPVIATDLGGFRETIVDGVTGLLVPPGDADALANAIAGALALDDEQRAAIAAEAMGNIQATFTRERMCAATLDVYRELV